MTSLRSLVLAASCGLMLATPAAAQEQLRVFIDCQFFCDMDHLRTELAWVDHVRDPAVADVHVLVTQETTGGGGRRHTLELIGLRDFAGVRDTLVFNSSVDATDVIRRQQLARQMAIGLIRYVAGTPTADRLTIGFAAAPPSVADAPEPATDPWNFWTFTVGTSGNMDGEKSRESYRLSGSLSANRTTEEWKVNLRLSGNYNEQQFTFQKSNPLRDTTIVSITRNYNLNGLLVKSLGPHISAGMTGNIGTSTFGNTELSVTLEPAIEYNFYPYSESTRRQFTARYGAGLAHYQYRDTTVYLQIEETRPIHSLELGYATRQPWGSVNVGADLSQYLHDTSLYGADISGGVSDIRLFKGFSFNLFGNYSLIRNQITLAKENLSPEEVLLRQRELETGYRYFINVGINYRFGSIFNNVVNPRFGGGGRGGMMIFM